MPHSQHTKIKFALPSNLKYKEITLYLNLGFVMEPKHVWYLWEAHVNHEDITCQPIHSICLIGLS